MALDEENVAGEDRPVRRHMDEHVARRVRGADMHHLHRLRADLPRELRLEDRRRQRLRHALEVEGAETVDEKLAEIAEAGRRL